MTTTHTGTSADAETVTRSPEPAPWANVFEISTLDGQRIAGDHLRIDQLSKKQFRLQCQVRFTGSTGLEAALDKTLNQVIREVDPSKLPTTDLATVPTALLWFVPRYGVHTPAALIHDWLIGDASSRLDPRQADRYFRSMLEAVGVPWLRRWMMWSAVALRTQWNNATLTPGRIRVNRACMVAWVGLSVVGQGLASWGAVQLLALAFNRLPLGDASVMAMPGWLGQHPGAAVSLLLLAPLLAGTLWGHQYLAGLVGAYTAPFVLPPTLACFVGLQFYRFAEWLIGRTGVNDGASAGAGTPYGPGAGT